MLLTDNVQVTHFLPGRLRLKAPAIRGQAAAAKALGDAIRSIPGIKTLEINPLTGSLLITYDTAVLASEGATRQLRIVLREHLPGLDPEPILKWLGANKSLF